METEQEGNRVLGIQERRSILIALWKAVLRRDGARENVVDIRPVR
jgi:hypothetical protein